MDERPSSSASSHSSFQLPLETLTCGPIQVEHEAPVKMRVAGEGVNPESSLKGIGKKPRSQGWPRVSTPLASAWAHLLWTHSPAQRHKARSSPCREPLPLLSLSRVILSPPLAEQGWEVGVHGVTWGFLHPVHSVQKAHRQLSLHQKPHTSPSMDPAPFSPTNSLCSPETLGRQWHRTLPSWKVEAAVISVPGTLLLERVPGPVGSRPSS